MIPVRHSQIIRIVTLLITIFSLSLPAYAQYSGGTGEQNDPYQIATAEDLMLLGETPNDYDKHFILTADIDLDPNLPGRKVLDKALIAPDVDSPQDYYGTPFRGTFDGNGCTIRNLFIDGDSYLGLFGSFGRGAQVRDLHLVNARVFGKSEIGILVGYNQSGHISCCYSDGTVSGDIIVGGLVGYNGPHSGSGGIISHCYSASSVVVGGLGGGLVGINNGSITKSYSVGNVDKVGLGVMPVGGLVGNGVPFMVVDSFWDVETSGHTTSAGGLGLTTREMMDPYWYALNGWAGDPNWVLDSGKDYPRLAYEATGGQPIPEATIEWLDGNGTSLDPYRLMNADQLFQIGRASILWNAYFVLCTELDLSQMTYSTAVIPSFSGTFDGCSFNIHNLTITGLNTLGLFGRLEDGAVVKNVGIVDAKVTSRVSHAGILAGFNSGDVTNCYSSGMVTGGGDWIGGLVGYNVGRVTGCFSTSNVRGESYYVGGLAGANTKLVACCYSTGAVSGGTQVGGLVGYNHGGITESYSTGYVSGQSDVGGLVGKQSGGSVSHSFWDIQTSRFLISAGGMGKTSIEMQNPDTFMTVGWDFVNKPDGPSNIWAEPVEGGYPILWWQLSPIPELPTFSGGTGKPEAPYFITTAGELTSIGHNGRLMEAHFKLMADIDLMDLPIYPIGNNVYPYAGVFDGNGHTISNLTYDSNGVDYIGLFGYVTNPDAEIKDMGLINHHIDAGTGDYVGSLVGYLVNGIITRCSVEGGSVSAGRSVGGLVGFNSGGYITTSDSTGTVTGKGEVGGLVGGNWGNIATSYSSCTVTGDGSHGWVGGLVGQNYGLIATSHSSGTVTGDGWVGGLVGGNYGGIATSHSSGTVTGDGSVGGLAGENRGNIARSCSSSNVAGDGRVGGLAGANDSTITNCYATGSILASGTELSAGIGGGLVGENLFWSGKISNCYATGSVLVSGTELSPSVGGGLVGMNGGEVMDSLWDIQTSGQEKSDGGTGKTTSEMHMENTFTDDGWDFWDESENGTEGTWSICEGVDYPRLIWQFVVGDFNADDYVDFADFCIFAAHWLGTDSSFFCGNGGTDLTNDGEIDIHDMREFAKCWLRPQPSEPPAPSPPGPPPKGRACFLPDTPVWVNGGLVQISNVVIGQMVTQSDNSRLTNACFEHIEEVEEHEGMFECHDIVLESGDCISVVDAHCFMLDSGQWVAAPDLRSGFRLKTQSGTVSIEHIVVRAAPFVGKVYNIKIKGSDQYFVGIDRVIVRDY